MNVLYLGMADDILTPLVLCPDLTNLYVISHFDSAFTRGNTVQDQRNDIIELLTDGDDINSYHAEIRKQYNDDFTPIILGDKCQIIRDSLTEQAWYVDFILHGKIRHLEYYYHDYITERWSESINNISTVMCMGAPFGLHDDTFEKMIVERATSDCKLYDIWQWSDILFDCQLRDHQLFCHQLSEVLNNGVYPYPRYTR